MRRRSKSHDEPEQPVEPQEPLDSADPEAESDDDAPVWDIEEVSEDDLLSETDSRINDLEIEVEELKDKYQRSLADFQNYQRRSLQNERDARQQGVRDVLESLLGVLDHFELALAQDIEKTTAEQIVSGVSVIKSELLRVLQMHGVELISPEQGAEFDPNRHEAVVHQPAEGVEPGHVAAALQAGYTIRDRVVRPAKVAVTPEAVTEQTDEPEQSED